jgi:hypothetical protein
MKKIFTFLFSTLLVSSVFAQSGHDRNERKTIVVSFNISNDHERGFRSNENMDGRIGNYDRWHNQATYNENLAYQRDQEIQKINNQYNFQVQQVINNCSLNRWEKKNAISNLQAQRDQQIVDINCRFDIAKGGNAGYRYDNR